MHHYFFAFFSAIKRGVGALLYLTNVLFGLCFTFFCVFAISSAEAQVCGTSGLDGPQNAIPPVNTYFPLASNVTLTAGSKSITLEAVPPDDQNNNLSYGITPIKSGDLILIIQMQDASFNYTNSDKYGSGLSNSGPDNLGGTGYTAIGNSGKFEYVVATSDVGLTGGVLTFRGGGAGKGCVNTFSNADANATSGQKRFQVVRVPQYSTLVLTTNLTTPPYNGSVGGIIAFDVAGTMKFNGFEINASERGFRGGYGPVASSGKNDRTIYAVASTSNKSVGKGEGVAGTPRYMWDGFKQVDNIFEGLPGGSYGRGAPANAGGAGNDHNAGGGGGGNGGFGGLGGMGWQGANGDVDPLNAGGRPGYNLPVDPSRLTMGGGGGGGDANNATSGVKGGVGGGIILINVEKIDGVGVIKSNGGIGQAGAFGSAPDGAGGGGAGGTIFVRSLAPSPTAVLTLEAKGGRGGNTENDNNNAHGPGGGGGGGFIYSQVSSAVINNNVGKGNSGKSHSGAGINHGAKDGTAGVVQSFATTDLPTYLQGGGSICYPALDITLTEENAGSGGIRPSGTSAIYKLKVYNNVGGGNAGNVSIDFELPYGFSLVNVVETLSGDAASSSPLTFTVGAKGKMSFGTYNISPGDDVELTIQVNIANNVPTGIYHASAQANYLDPTRTNANPIREITAANEHFIGENTSYETGTAMNVPGTNYNGNLSTRSTEDVYINAPAVVGECSAIVDGGFETTPVGVYDAPNYTGLWQVATINDKVAIVSQSGLKGALIRNNGIDNFSLQQKLAYIQPLSDYTLVFNYRNWTDEPCTSVETPKIRIEILDAADNSVLAISPDFESQASPSVGVLNFTTATNTQAVILKVYDAGSPATACGVFVDDFDISSPLSIHIGKEDVKCFDGTDGKLTITSLIGAAGPYKISYSGDGGANFSNPENTGIITSANPFEIENLKAGDYVLRIIDENDCLNVRDFSISQPLKLKLSGTSTEIKCYGGFSKVTLSASGGTSPYRYSLDGVDYQNQNTFPDLVKNDYTFYVKDANGCIAEAEIQIVEPTLINLSAEVTNILCFEGKAKVKLTAEGGTGGFEYSMDGLVFQNSNIFNDVLPGPQSFTVRDENQCMQVILVEITEPSELKLSSENTAIKCFGGTSEVTLTGEGGTGVYSYSKDGTNFQSGNTFTGLIADDYTFTVKDANDCATTIAVSITEPSELKLSSENTAIKCFGGASEVKLKGEGGTGVYTYSKDGTNFQSENTFTGLLADDYTFTVKDANDCTTTIAVNITEPAELNLSSDKTAIKCFGGISEVKLKGEGGTGVYTYSKDGTTFQSENTFTGLIADNYTFTVKDANDCATTIAVSITEPAKLKLSSENTEIKCFGGTSEVKLKGEGGTGAYTYSKDGTNFQSGNTFTGLLADDYTFTVKDANDCATTIAVSITEPSELKVEAENTTIKCFGGASEVKLKAEGGTGVYTYSKDGITFQSGNTFTGLLADDYTFTVKDANDCATTIAVSITEPAELKLSSENTAIKCFGGTSEVKLKGEGGTGVYSYSKDGTNFQSGNTFTGLLTDDYTFTVKDANDCATNIAVSIIEPSELKLSSENTTIKCFGGTSEVKLKGEGGAGVYTYSKDGTNFQPGNTFTGLLADDYTFTVKDANDCATTIAVSITEPAKLKLSSENITIKCFGGISEVKLKAEGGTGIYTYSKDGTNFQSENTFTGLIADDYTFTVKDANDCATTIAVSITEPSELKLSSENTAIKCFEGTSEVELTATGGTGVYSYSKDGINFQSGNTFTGLIADDYTFTLKDGNDCATTIAVSIAEPSELKLSSENTAIKCFGGTSEVTLTGEGGTGVYSYSKDGTNSQSGNTFTGLLADDYTFTVKDANDCATTIAVSITEPAKLKLTSENTAIKCFGGTSEVTLTANGGTGVYQYSKDGTTFQSGNTFTGLLADDYNFTVKDKNDCVTIIGVSITEPTELKLSSENTTIKCFGGTSEVKLTGDGGTGVYKYSKDGTNFQSGNTFNGLVADDYTFTVKDANDCSTTIAVSIIEPSELKLSSEKTTIKCFGGTSEVKLTGEGGTGAYTYSKDGTIFQSGNTFAGLLADDYTFTIKDANDCATTIAVSITEPSELKVEAENTTIKCFGGKSEVTLTANGGTGVYQYSKDGTNFQSANTFTGLLADDYTFTVKDANDCATTIAVSITEPSELKVEAENSVIKCFGGTSEVTLSGEGGTGVYSYSKDGTNFQSENIFTGLIADDYTFTVKDANDCATTIAVSITEPAKLKLSSENTAIKCFGGTSEVTLTANGGTGVYQYSKDGTNFQSANTFTGLLADDYTFTVKDANDCATTIAVSITEPSELKLSSENTAIKCFGGTSEVKLKGEGGTEVYTYSKDGSNFQSGDTFTGLLANDYTFTVKDANDCATTIVVSITEPSELKLSSENTAIKCFGGTSEVTLTGEGGTGVYTYSKDGTNFQSKNTFTGLLADDYIFTVKDANDCATTIAVSITEPAELKLNSENTAVKCFGGISEVKLTGEGGTGIYKYSKDGTNFQSGNTFTGLIADDYTFTVKDANDCATTIAVSITEPAKLKLSSENTEIKCFGGASEVTLTATGGTGIYQYSKDGTNFQSGNIFTGIIADDYTFTVKDANDCATTIAVSITEPAELKLSSENTAIKCFGGTSEIKLTTTGGTGVYTYSKDGTNFQSKNTFTGLLADDYTFTIKDANDCATTIAVSITEPSELKVEAENTTIKCFGGASEVKLTASGGTGVYSYSKDGINFQSGNTFTGLIADDYTFTVKDANDCATTIAVSITEPAKLKLSSENTAIKCFGGTSAVKLIAEGGTGAYTYSKDGITFQSGNAFTGLLADDYTFTVKDANDCATTIAVSITEPSELKLNSEKIVIKCFSGTSEVKLTGEGGTGVYTYSKDGTNFQSGNTFTGLLADDYTFTVKDANECATTIAVSITEPSELKLNSENTTIKCFGGTSEVTLTATGGTGVYTYSKDGTNFQSENTFTGLLAGNYTFTVKDANDCVTTIAVSITEPAELKVEAEKTTIKCFGGTSEVKLKAEGGTGAYTYSKDGTNFQSGNTFTGLLADDYTFTVKDANECATTIAVSITEPAELKLNSENTAIKCFGGASEVTLTVAGGTGIYQYSKDGTNFQSGNTFTGLLADDCTFTVKDANGCATTIAVSITEPAKLKLSSENTEIKCFGGTSEVKLRAEGGTGVYTYSKDGTNFQSGNTFTGLLADDYTFTVKDANGCATTIAVSITEPAKLKLSSENTEIKCFGGTSEVKLRAEGGTGVYTYSKDGTNFQSGNIFTGLLADDYTFTVKDANDCETTIAVSITEPPELKAEAENTTIKCFGGISEVKLKGEGGTGAYTYSKDGTTFQSGNTFTSLLAGGYTFTVKDENDCVNTIFVKIDQPSLPISIIGTHENNVCYSEEKGKIETKISGGTAPYKYLWSNGATTQNITNLAPGVYSLTVTDQNGCTQTLSTQILPLKPFVITEQIQQIKCFGGNSGEITLELNGGEAPYQVSWSNGASGLRLKNLAPGNYTYTAKDAFGCIQTKTIIISQPQLLSAKAEVKNTTCKYSPDGAIKLNVSGGTQPYKFIWNSTDRGQNNSLLNVNVGKYNITVIDANNCSIQISAEVLPGNCAPSADNDRYETKEDTPIIINTPGVIVNDLDPDDDQLKVTLASAKDPSGEVGDVDASNTVFRTKNGKVILNQDGSFTYFPNKNFVGTEHFIYEVNDGELKSNFAQVTIVVTEVNDPPNALDDFFITVEDTPVNGSVATNDSDPENEQLNYIITTQPSSGNVTLNPDGTFTYIPEENFDGTVTFNYQVCDPQGLCAQATATVTVTPVNDPPIAADDKFTIQRNGQISQTVTLNDSDADGDPLQFTKLTNPTNGSLVFNANGTFVYQPNPNFKGLDQFTYRACDPSGLCDDATVILVIQPIVTVNLIPKEATIKEGDSIKVTAVLTESLVEDVTVYLSFSGTAEVNKDYVLMDNYVSIIIPANQTETTQYFSINTILDDVKDDNEVIISNISSTSKPAYVNIGNNSTVTVTDVYPEAVTSDSTENPDINPDPLISPNGDGLGNESFIIYNITKYPDNEVLIFNRWGNKVYQTRGYDNKGNSFKGIANVGILTNSNTDLVDGVYYYIIYTDENNKRKMNKGYLILKR